MSFCFEIPYFSCRIPKKTVKRTVYQRLINKFSHVTLHNCKLKGNIQSVHGNSSLMAKFNFVTNFTLGRTAGKRTSAQELRQKIEKLHELQHT